ncbi:hypothetical protein D9M71_519140 [compost metagenome]
MGKDRRRQLRHFLRQRCRSARLQRSTGGRWTGLRAGRPTCQPGRHRRRRDRQGQRLRTAPEGQRSARRGAIRHRPALVRAGVERHRVRRLCDELPQPQSVHQLQADRGCAHHRRAGSGHRWPGDRDRRHRRSGAAGRAGRDRAEPDRPAPQRALLHRLSGRHPPLRPELPDQRRRYSTGWRSQLSAEHAAADQYHRREPGGTAADRPTDLQPAGLSDLRQR